MATKNPNNPNEILVNLKQALEAADGGWEDTMRRYNGGWIKTVMALDKSKDNGYSIVGDFVRKETAEAYQRIGLYLDCDIGGSRKHPVKHYTLFSIDQEGKATIHHTLKGTTSDWAIRLWPHIEKYFAAQEAIKEQSQTKEAHLAFLRQQREQLLKDLVELEAQIAALL